MGGIVGVVVCALAAGAFYGTDHPAVFWVCVALAVVSFWSWGVMHNYVMTSAKSRRARLRENMLAEGRSPDEIERIDLAPVSPSSADIESVPDWLSTVNMAATALGFIFLCWGVVLRIF